MIQEQKNDFSSGIILLIFVLLNVVILEYAFTVNEAWYAALMVTFPPFLGAAIYHKGIKKVHSKSL